MNIDTESTAVSRRMKNVRSGGRCVYSLLVPGLYPLHSDREAGRSHNRSWRKHMSAHTHMCKCTTQTVLHSRPNSSSVSLNPRARQQLEALPSLGKQRRTTMDCPVGDPEKTQQTGECDERKGSRML